MDEIIRVKNVSYDRYEELLMQRDAIKKEAFRYGRAYTREFGDLILEIFQLKIDCIRKKKTIEFYQAALNRGQTIDTEQLQEYLQKELAAFQAQLEEMIVDTESAQKMETITEYELLQIKKIYHKMVKKIHPDINPMVEKSEELQELWQRILVAYNCNDLKLMQETEVLVTKVLEQMGEDVVDVEIPNIEGKIKELETEIVRIREKDPYQYKYILEDPEAVEEKKRSLREEKKSYEEYGNQLDDILASYMENGVSFTWRMN